MPGHYRSKALLPIGLAIFRLTKGNHLATRSKIGRAISLYYPEYFLSETRHHSYHNKPAGKNHFTIFKHFESFTAFTKIPV